MNMFEVDDLVYFPGNELLPPEYGVVSIIDEEPTNAYSGCKCWARWHAVKEVAIKLLDEPSNGFYYDKKLQFVGKFCRVCGSASCKKGHKNKAFNECSCSVNILIQKGCQCGGV